MVTWNCFMQRERFHLPLWSRMQIESIHKVVAGTAYSWCTRLIVRSRLRWRLEIRYRGDAVLIAWQSSKFVRELGINCFRDNFVSVNQVLRLLEVESQVVSQKFGELVEAAF